MSTVLEAIARRSSTRGYTADALTQDQLDVIIAAGLQAPTAANRQEVHFTVLKGDHPILAEIEAEKNKKRPGGTHNFYYEAPLVILISADASNHWGVLDAGIAVENMALAAEGLGLGSLIIGCIYDAMRGERKEEFQKALAIPEGYIFEIALALGNKAVSKEPHTYEIEKQVTFF